MVAADDAPSYARRLGIQKDQVVQELGWDEDVEDDIRADIEEACGGELLDEDADEVIDVVLLWWRDGDGDLVDNLMDAITPLADDGVIWVVTPKTGKPGHVQPAEIAELVLYLVTHRGNAVIDELHIRRAASSPWF